MLFAHIRKTSLVSLFSKRITKNFTVDTKNTFVFHTVQVRDVYLNTGFAVQRENRYLGVTHIVCFADRMLTGK